LFEAAGVNGPVSVTVNGKAPRVLDTSTKGGVDVHVSEKAVCFGEMCVPFGKRPKAMQGQKAAQGAKAAQGTTAAKVPVKKSGTGGVATSAPGGGAVAAAPAQSTSDVMKLSRFDDGRDLEQAQTNPLKVSVGFGPFPCRKWRFVCARLYLSLSLSLSLFSCSS
jgi:hypothetical protein